MAASLSPHHAAGQEINAALIEYLVQVSAERSGRRQKDTRLVAGAPSWLTLIGGRSTLAGDPITGTPPKILISYNREPAEHQARVVGLADRLRSDGVDAEVASTTMRRRRARS